MASPPTTPLAAAELSALDPALLKEVEQAFALAPQRALTAIDVINVVQKLTSANQIPLGVRLYRTWLEQADQPVAYAVQFNLAVLLENSGDDAGAVGAYRSTLTLNPSFAEAYFNLANLCARTGRTTEAIETSRKFLASIDRQRPPVIPATHLQAANSLWQLLEMHGELADAQNMLALSLRREPQQTELLGHWVRLRQRGCLWPVHDTDAGITQPDMLLGTPPTALLSLTDDPGLQLESARRYVGGKVQMDIGHYMSSKSSYGHDRLRIAYLISPSCLQWISPDFFGLHDRSKVEISGFCWGLDESMPQHGGVIANLDHCIHIDTVSDQEAARQIRFREIDILVDPHGLNAGARPNIHARRPAPIQIAWPGYPGTTANPGLDYVIADSVVLPPDLEPYFTETPLRMPVSFRPALPPGISALPTTRAQHGLPDDAVVYRAPRDPAKYTPAVFSAWMDVLKRVPAGVLWLPDDNATMRASLCAHASASGISPSRLCFDAQPESSFDTSRLRLADLFLDTHPCSAADEAQAALRDDLPVVTCVGRSFASRTAASLLEAVGLPQLVAENLPEYADLAVSFGSDRAKLLTLKRELAQRRLNAPMSDTGKFVKELENLFVKLVQGLPPRPEKPRYTEADTAYIRAPYAGHGADRHSPSSDRRYVIAAPPFSHNSAGIRVLYDLQKWLICAGQDAIVCTWFPGYPVDQFADDIVIYPEVAPGNLLNAKRVIRYILNEPGKLGYGEKQYDKNEILVAYNKELAPYANGVVLQVPSIEPFFNSRGAIKTRNAVYVGKGKDLGKHPADCVMITKTFPATRREVAEFLRSVETLYMYDDFSMIALEAELCGCTVRLIRKDGTITDYTDLDLPTLEEFKVQLHEFIELTQRL